MGVVIPLFYGLCVIIFSDQAISVSIANPLYTVQRTIYYEHSPNQTQNILCLITLPFGY